MVELTATLRAAFASPTSSHLGMPFPFKFVTQESPSGGEIARLSIWNNPKCCNMLGLPGGFARNLNIWGGVGWGGAHNVPCNCTHLGATQLMFLALAHISMLRN